jgi:hypothetical protein
MLWYNAIVAMDSSLKKSKKEGEMRLYEIFRNGKVVPYWLRNGLAAGVGIPIPTSELFRVHGVKRIGRGYLYPVRENGRTFLALLAECDRDSRALVMVEALDKFNGGFIRIADDPRFVVELLPGGSITVSGRRYIWDGRNLRRI